MKLPMKMEREAALEICAGGREEADSTRSEGESESRSPQRCLMVRLKA